MSRAAIAAALFVACSAIAPVARADARTYLGPHPLDLEGHWHFEEGVHAHGDLPIGADAFAEVEGALVFLADPLAWGYVGDVWTYRGVHPLPGGARAYCGMTGDHRHEFAPEGAYRVDEAAGAYVYAGALRGGVAMVRPGRAAPPRPVVVAAPPSAVVVPYGYGPRYVRPRRSAPPPSPPLPSVFEGRYSRIASRPHVAPRTIEPPRQRRPER